MELVHYNLTLGKIRRILSNLYCILKLKFKLLTIRVYIEEKCYEPKEIKTVVPNYIFFSKCIRFLTTRLLRPSSNYITYSNVFVNHINYVRQSISGNWNTHSQFKW